MFYAAFSRHRLGETELIHTARQLIRLAPQLAAAVVSDATLAKIVASESVENFDGLPDARLSASGLDVYADPALPSVRLRAAVRKDGPDADGRASFLMIRVSHALVEGMDSALLSRSRPAEHPPQPATRKTTGAVAFAARSFAGFATIMHTLLARFIELTPGPLRVVTRALPRKTLTGIARELGVCQRALFFGVAAHAVLGAGAPGGKSRFSSTYSTIDSRGGERRDRYMRMRMLFAVFDNATDFPALVRAMEQRLTAGEKGERGFNAEMNAAAIGLHRRLAKKLPLLYSPKIFRFMPYDIVLGLIPPHRLSGALTEGLMEPVYAGATVPGCNGCVIVPGREFVTFNFAIEDRLVPRLARFDDLIAGLVHAPTAKM